jgi:glycosyltransferase involved in cell wall biosynthesis
MDLPSVITEWGPDLSFSGYEPARATRGVFTAGRTHRDTATLASAAAAAKVRLVAHTGSTPFEQLLEDLGHSIAVAIPLSRTDGSFGLTEVNDALASGKPILMTRNPYIDLDLEGVGCGHWIERGDVEGWRIALERLKADPDEAEAMGARGRAFAETSWNYERFGRVLAAAVAAAGQ